MYSESFTRMVEDVHKPVVKNVMTKGLVDIVLDSRIDPRVGLRIIGHVGFHDIDDRKINIDLIAQKAALELDTPIAILKTMKGFHLVSLEVMDDERWWAWKWWMRKNLLSDLKDGICDKCEVQLEIFIKDDLYWYRCPKCSYEEVYTMRLLRIESKGDDPKPRLVKWCLPKGDRLIDISDKHLLKYQEQGIMTEIPYPNIKLVHTTGMLLPYETKAEVSK